MMRGRRAVAPTALRAQGGAGTFTLGWLLVLAFVGWFFYSGYTHWLPFAARTPQVTATGEVLLKRNRAGHFVASGAINGVPVNFLVDTGATQIAIPMALAQRLGLKLGPSVGVHTAAGPARGYITRLDSVEVATIEVSNLSAIVTEGLHPDLVLLGMNFLRRIEMVLRGDELILRPMLTQQASARVAAPGFALEPARSR
jgi:aspartyl protease family protein